MKWVYTAVWLLAAWRELPPLWKENRRREFWLWLMLAGLGLWLAVCLFWMGTDWRLF